MPARIVVAGGGVAAVETAAALRALIGAEPVITVVTPAAEIEQRPLSVMAPFRAPPPPLSLADISSRAGFELRLGRLATVVPERHEIWLADDTTLGYDRLVVATGALPQPAFPGALTFGGIGDTRVVAEALRSSRQPVFVVHAASVWAVPLYELALITALERPEADVAVVTAEPAPLWIFGAEAGEALRELFVQRGVGLLTGVRVLAATQGMLELDGMESVTADHAIALPRLVGPAIGGLPHDELGFIPVDAFGAVTGLVDVYAAGDVTTFPLKQGGLAAEQADTVAEAIAADLGADVNVEPFEPVLRGLLLTGGPPLYLRSDGARGTSGRLARATVSGSALWWPPAKVAGRYLAPLLGDEADAPTLRDLPAPPDGGRPEPENAAELAWLLASEDAMRGDYARALHGLETAETLTGGRIPPEWERARTMWRARADWAPG